MESAEESEEGVLSRSRRNLCTLKESVNLISASQVGLFVIVLAYALHRSKPVLLPLVLAILASLVLRPIYAFIRRLHVPRMLAALVTVVGLFGLLGFGSYQLVQPGSKWMETIDREVVMERMQEVFRPVKEVQAEIKDVADQVEKATKAEPKPKPEDESGEDAEGNDGAKEPLQNAPPEDAGEADGAQAVVGPWQEVELVAVAEPEAAGDSEDQADPPPEPEPVVVEIREDPMDVLAVKVQEFGIGTAAFLFLVLFILSYGNRIAECLSEDEGTAAILDRVGVDVSSYLFTITLINGVLGLAIGLAMWALGMPNPALWGVLAMVLNFIPYVGALIGVGIVFVVAAATFDSASSVLLVPLSYFVLTAIEGNVVTPLVLGGRFRLNPLVVFVWIFAWAAFWGIAGMLIAMPALVTFKIICENTATMERFRRLLTA